MRRTLLLAVVGSMLLVASAGVAWAADVFCSGGPCEGTELSDFITGTPQSDQISALGGFDEVFALAGQDELRGNNGGDELAGEDGRDTYFGGNGSDALSEFNSLTEVTNSRNDEMNGGPGEDFIEGNTGPDILSGQDGVECGSLEEVDSAEVSMFGDEGNDQLFGGAGEDCMEGEARDARAGQHKADDGNLLPRAFQYAAARQPSAWTRCWAEGFWQDTPNLQSAFPDHPRSCMFMWCHKM